MKHIEVLLLVDDSGSMEPAARDVIGTFNGFLTRQVRTEHGKSLLTLTVFNHEARELYAALPLFAAPQLTEKTYMPSGMTALYDALCQLLLKHTPRIVKENWADEVLVVVITDGEDTASHLHNQAGARQLVRERMQAGWKFLFLAAGDEAVLAADALGFTGTQVREFSTDPEGLALAFNEVAGELLLLAGPASRQAGP